MRRDLIFSPDEAPTQGVATRPRCRLAKRPFGKPDADVFKAGSFEMLGVSECKPLASERLASPRFLRDEAEKSDIAVFPAAHTAIVAKLIVATRTWFSQPNSVGTTCPLDKG